MVESEHYIIGAVLSHNDCIDRIPSIEAKHFGDGYNRAYFAEITKQIAAGKTVDGITVAMALPDSDKAMAHIVSITANSAGTAMLERHAGIVIDAWMKRGLQALGTQLAGIVESQTPAIDIANDFSAQIEAVIEQKEKSKPVMLSDSLAGYVEAIQARIDGVEKPISTGFQDLDRILDGGFERGTLTVVAARPAMGKTAFGLALARNAATDGTSLILSMEMPTTQLNDRNIAALGRIPVSWLRRPDEDNKEFWDRMTFAFSRANELRMYIDDQPGANLIEIRSKARSVRRKSGLDVLIIDQLSFITGSDKEQWQAVGDYTRGLLAIAKELGIAVVLLCQLNRDCEKRQNKRPIMADLALSGSIEQDAATIIFLYRDEVYNPDSIDKGMCELSVAKARQGSTGIVGLAYIGTETRFESAEWVPKPQGQSKAKGFM